MPIAFVNLLNYISVLISEFEKSFGNRPLFLQGLF